MCVSKDNIGDDDLNKLREFVVSLPEDSPLRTMLNGLGMALSNGEVLHLQGSPLQGLIILSERMMQVIESLPGIGDDDDTPPPMAPGLYPI